MFKNRMLPCAAGDRCLLKPKLADPQHKCPKCRQNINAICGILDVDAQIALILVSYSQLKKSCKQMKGNI